MSDKSIVRRSANYQPSIWNDDFIQSLNAEVSTFSYTRRINELKSQVRKLLDGVENLEEKAELISILQRLGLGYQFEDDIKRILENLYNDKYTNHNKQEENDLHAAALQFRLLREHGYQVSQEIFNSFKDTKGEFKVCDDKDINGIISLYEASFISEEGESILEDARVFTTKILQKFVRENEGKEYHSILANHALEIPLQYRLVKLEARWFIDVYEKDEHMNPLLLKLAKLDFNYIQAMHQEDLKQVSRWWSNTGLSQKLDFARDRVLECFFWAAGMIFQPNLSNVRIMLTKVGILVTAVDDIYDVYGTLDELEQFTTAIERWNVDALEELPTYMQLCFLALYNSANEIGFDILMRQGLNVIPYLKESWLDLCKSYLLEAKWYYCEYTPTLQEYLDNGWITIGCPIITVHLCSWLASPITKDVIECVKSYPPIVKCSSIILRLVDDLGTSSEELKRGDVAKAIQCHMQETGATETESREYISYLVGETWKKMNKDRKTATCLFPETFVDAAMNMARVGHCMYQNGDGFGSPASTEIKHHILSLLINSISLN